MSTDQHDSLSQASLGNHIDDLLIGTNKDKARFVRHFLLRKQKRPQASTTEKTYRDHVNAQVIDCSELQLSQDLK